MGAIWRIGFCIMPIYLLTFEWAIEARGGYFRFANSDAREIYRDGTPDVELEGFFFANRHFMPWINANYVWREGRSEAVHNKTEMKMGTGSIGAKVRFPARPSSAYFYLGLGLSAAYLHLWDHSSFLPHVTTRWSVGCVGKGGILIYIYRNLFTDLFFDYYYQPMKTRSSLPQNSLNLGGFRTGGGVGWSF